MNNIPETSKSIKITAVANGYTVEMPTGNNELQELMNGMMKTIHEGIEGGSEIDKLIKESLGNVVTPVVPTVKNVHIFKTFPEVLNFLAEEVK